MSDSKRIAKNTIFLYLRMLLIMGATLYTSRIVLASLGIEDYGLYNVVGGIVVMLSFLNNSAAGATSRFLTFSLGSKNHKDGFNFQDVFSVAFFNHIVIAFLIAIFAETIGLWYFKTHLVIPAGRDVAAMWVYQISIITMFVSFTQIPYNASLVAHEKMNIYAYIGIYEALYRLMVAYLISITTIDKLKFYSVLLFFGTLSVSLFYRIYCVKKFSSSCQIKRVQDTSLFKRMLSYSGWDLLGNFSGVARSQGVNLILNMFCGPAVNAARAIAYQVEGALYQFTTNFLQASRPVIVKRYAAGEIKESLSLLQNTAKFACLLFSCFAIPFILESDTILGLWLVEVPQYASIFLKIVLANYLIISITNTINIGVHATGDVKRLNIYAGSKVFLEIPIIYFLLKNGYEPYWAFIVLAIGSFFIVFVDLWVLRKNVPQLSISSFYIKVILTSVGIMSIPSIVAFFIHSLDFNKYCKLVSVMISYWFLIVPAIFLWGMDKSLKAKILGKIKKRKVL